jgi:hypothetical protein
MGTLSRDALIGTWTLTEVSAQWRNRAARVRAHGTLVYTPGGDVSVVLEVSPSKHFRIRKAIAYTGRFHIDGDEVVHQVTSGTWPFGSGREFRRRATVLPGPCLHLALVGMTAAVNLSLTWWQL